jgi:hypothetical protein
MRDDESKPVQASTQNKHHAGCVLNCGRGDPQDVYKRESNDAPSPWVPPADGINVCRCGVSRPPVCIYYCSK